MTSSKDAARAAKRLVGQFANLRPDNPEEFLRSIADVFEQYPLGLVDECVDPRGGVARKVEFLSLKSLGEWLDTRLAFWSGIAAFQAPARSVRRPELSDDDRAKGLAAWRGLQMLLARGDVDRAKAVSFEAAAELGAGDLNKPVRLMIPRMDGPAPTDDQLRERYKAPTSEAAE